MKPCPKAFCPGGDGASNWQKAPSRNDMVYLARGYQMRLRHCLDRKVFWVSEKHVASDI